MRPSDFIMGLILVGASALSFRGGYGPKDIADKAPNGAQS